MLRVLAPAGKTLAQEQLTFAHVVLDYISCHITVHQKGAEISELEIDKVVLLDALCDQIVTAVGVAHMFGMNIGGALTEVARSKDSKFGADGQLIFNENRKIMKGPNYQAPDLAPFVIGPKQG